MRASTKILLCCLAGTLIACSGPGGADDGDRDPTHGAAGAGDPYYPNDGNGGYDAFRYEVSISYDPEERHLNGDSEMFARATEDLTRFNLDLRELDVESVRVNDQEAEFEQQDEFELVITPDDRIAEGQEFITSVQYSGEPTAEESDEVGALGWHTTSEGAVYALGQPHSAAYWYPVNETPRDKARFFLDVRVPEGWTAVSVGGEGEHTTDDDGWTTYRWREGNPVASYLTTVAIDDFTLDRSVLDDGTPVVSGYAPGATDKRAYERDLDDIIGFLSERFGAYPQSAAGGIYTSEDLSFALETQGRPTYAAWADELVVVHEYAHQWFGNSVSVESWSDLCLNECLASYIEWLWEEDTADVDLDERYRSTIDEMPEDGQFWSNKLHEMGAGNEFDGVYDKGQLAIHALRHKVGPDVFVVALRHWADEHEHGNASWRDFEEFIGERTDEDLTEFLDAWFRGEERPAEEHLYPGSLGE